MKKYLALALLWIAGSHFATDGTFPWLHTLDAGDGVKASGLQLVGLTYGLHALEVPEQGAIELMVGVHGMRSAGYEWIYPLQTIDSDSRRMYFFNWDTTAEQCQLDVATNLQADIQRELEAHTKLASVSVIGHSLGGVVVAQLADRWQVDVPLTIHTVAAPLALLDSEKGDPSCPQQLPKNSRENVRFIQWRTQFELDNAFNSLDRNPMDVEIPNSIVVTLPETYRERRLGHNWSISYVAERIAAASSVQ